MIGPKDREVHSARSWGEAPSVHENARNPPVAAPAEAEATRGIGQPLPDSLPDSDACTAGASRSGNRCRVRCLIDHVP